MMMGMAHLASSTKLLAVLGAGDAVLGVNVAMLLSHQLTQDKVDYCCFALRDKDNP
jgi:hypothetical protein